MGGLILNADDYALDEAVDRAILDLAARKIVTAASAMVLSPRWREAAVAIADRPIDVGLHLDLTSHFAAPVFPVASLRALIGKAYAGRLDVIRLRAAVDVQLDRFEAELGRRPDFIDGHQHVHQLPVIRLELLDALKRRYGSAAGAIGLRICKSRRPRGLKAELIGALGANRFAALAQGHPVNSDFLGVYGFSPRADLEALWKAWLSHPEGEAPLAMCHVAVEGPSGGDPIRAARLREFAWLGSGAFADLCAEFSITPARWPVRVG
ncbi:MULTISPECIES: ChbG/HpnK family deacetylase [Rhodomicrobium]|uniref:ChbG/HpnK family deacetylase n=1 Tax=Rhodomicrobium TaxID=1068 RepID=UPI000B4BE95C|nr:MULTISPECIES: ChbG/HpnK family deacetylase [Rhodomicrobium]